MVILNLGCGYIEKDVVIWPKNPYQISGISVTPHPSHIPIRIESIDHCAYRPSCLHAYPISAIIPISHHAHQPSWPPSASNVMHITYQPLYRVSQKNTAVVFKLISHLNLHIQRSPRTVLKSTGPQLFKTGVSGQTGELRNQDVKTLVSLEKLFWWW